MIPVIKKLPGSYAEAKRAGFNARHDFWRIRIHWDLPYAPAILGQEVFEWWFKKKWNALFAGPFVAIFIWQLLTGSTAAIFASGLGAFAVFVLAMDFIPPLQRKMELIGKNIEVIIAAERMGSDAAVHRASEIRSLLNYSQFKGWDEQKIAAAFVSQTNSARKWIRRNEGKIERWLAQHERDGQ